MLASAPAAARPPGTMMTLPSSCGSSHSRITTVSAPAGIGSPVSIHSNVPAGSRTALPPVAAASAVPATASPAARTAMPSMAEQSDRGDGHRATIGPALTRPSASATGTCSAAGLASQPARVSESTQSA